MQAEEGALTKLQLFFYYDNDYYYPPLVGLEAFPWCRLPIPWEPSQPIATAYGPYKSCSDGDGVEGASVNFTWRGSRKLNYMY